MLDSYRKITEAVADRIEGWRTMDKNDLIRACEAHESDKFLSEGYVAAILCRYWSAINKYYASSYTSGVTKEDCFEWLTHSVIYMLNKKPWNKQYNSKKRVKCGTVMKDGKLKDVYVWEKGNIENALKYDPKGPDKCMNQGIATTRNIYYQSANNLKRKLNGAQMSSIDAMVNSDDTLPIQLIDESASDPAKIIESDLPTQLVEKLIRENHYIQAFVIDGIVNADTFKLKKNDNNESTYAFNKTKLSKHLRALDATYCRIFSRQYNADYEHALRASERLATSDTMQINNLIKKTFKEIKSELIQSQDEYCICL